MVQLVKAFAHRLFDPEVYMVEGKSYQQSLIPRTQRSFSTEAGLQRPVPGLLPGFCTQIF